MNEAAVIIALRTPIARFRGELASLSVPDLGAAVLAPLVEQAGMDPAEIDEVIMGNLLGSDWGNPARASLLAAGFPVSVPGMTLDRQCGSSLSAIAAGAWMIQTGMADAVIAGASKLFPATVLCQASCRAIRLLEVLDYKPSAIGFGHDVSMIRRPSISPDAMESRAGRRVRLEATEAVRLGLGISRAGSSGEGARKSEALPVQPGRLLRQDCSPEGWRPPPVLGGRRRDRGQCLPAERQRVRAAADKPGKAEAPGFRPLAVGVRRRRVNLRSWLGPIYSTRKLLQKTGYTMEDFDLVEINEAFAAQVIACAGELGIDRERLNVEGGAIAIGHPLAASGGVLAARMVHALRRRALRRGLITLCCGGGQGVSLIIQNADCP